MTCAYPRAPACCTGSEQCAHGQCFTGLTSCSVDADCINDTYCDNGLCIPYGVGPRMDVNPSCRRVVAVQRFSPQVQCRWTGPPAGDLSPNHTNVLSTPMVADFDFDNDPEVIRPSIVFVSYNYTDGGQDACGSDYAGHGYYGVIRIIDGKTCHSTKIGFLPISPNCGTPT